MQNTNRNFWLGLCGVLSLFFVAHAQENSFVDPGSLGSSFDRAQLVKTHSIEPIMLSFFESEDPDQIRGQIFFQGVRKADRLKLSAFDAAGARFYTQEYEIDPAVKQSQEFRFKAPVYGLSAGSRMEAELFNQDKLVGREQKTLPVVESANFYRISNLETPIDVDAGTGLARITFENGSRESISIRPQIKIWQQSVTPEKTALRDFFAVTTVGPKTRERLNFDFGLPRDPGVYRVEVVALDEEKKILSGALESFFVVPGDFALFDGVFFEQAGMAAQAPMFIRFVGGYEGSDESLDLQVNLDLVGIDGRVMERLVQPVQVPISRGSFSQVLRLEGDNDQIAKIRAQATLKNSRGEMLSEISDEKTFIDPQPVAEKSESPVAEEVQDTSEEIGLPGWLWYHWLGLGLAILILLILLWMLRQHYRRASRTFLWLILAGMSSVSFVPNASAALEVFWHHPVVGWHYNPIAVDDFSDFGVMKIQGNIFDTLTQKGFFYKVPERIVVSFYKDLSYSVEGMRQCTECFYMEADLSLAADDAECVNEDDYVGPEAEVCDNKTYRFEIDLPNALDEGQWGVQVLFMMDATWYGTNWVDADTGQWHRIYLDETRPNLPGAITYDGELSPLGGDLVYEARQPLESGPTGIVALNQGLGGDLQALNQLELRRQELRQVADAKIKDRNHLVAVEIFTREQAILNGVENATALDDEIRDVLIPQANALVVNPGFDPNNPDAIPDAQKGINDIALQIGNLNASHDVISPATILQTTTYISNLTTVNTNPGGTVNLDADITALEGTIAATETSIASVEGSLEVIKQVHVKEAIEVGLGCVDPDVEAGVSGSGCLDAVLKAPVRGNFCEYGDVCQTDAVRTYKICDQIGNCSDAIENESNMDWYDPVAPDANDFDVILHQDNVGGTETIITGDGANNVFAASDSIAIEIDGDDPNATYLTHPTFFDTDACGSGATSDFFRAQATDDFCTQARVRCPLSSSKRGMRDLASGGACIGDCPPGYALQGDFCVPFCDFRLFDGCFPFLLIGDQCDITTWIPDAATVPFGDPFTQVNNCGGSRQAVGTRSITGSVQHFLDGIETFGAFLYDGAADDGVVYLVEAPLDGGPGTYDGFSPVVSELDFADFSTLPGKSPNGGFMFRLETLDVDIPEGFAAWRRQNIPVLPNTDYVISYWVKTDMTVNTNQLGVWPRVTGNGASPNLYEQYSSTMEAVPGDLNWYKVIVEFTTNADTTEVELQMRGQGQINKEAFFDDIKLFEADWRFALDKSWMNEPFDDADGSCDYITGSGSSVVDGPDDRCGLPRFPEKTIVVAARDGKYMFDVEKGTFWLKATQTDNPSVKGSYVWNPLFDGQMYGLNGVIYSGFRFEDASGQHDGRQGALLLMDFIADNMFAHQVDDHHLLSGFKRDGGANDDVAERNIPRTNWENSMPVNEQIASQKINDINVNLVSGKTYVGAATDYGLSILNKTDNTVQHLEYSGFDADNYNWKDLPNDFNQYHQLRLMDDGSLWYQWDFNAPAVGKSRIWRKANFTAMPFNSSILQGNAIYDSVIEPIGTSAAYPTTALSGSAAAFEVTDDGLILSGGPEGLEKYFGTVSNGKAHPNLSRSWVSKTYAGAPLFGNVLGHWATSEQDIANDNNLTNVGGVTFNTSVATNTELTGIALNGTDQYLASGSSDFQISGPITFGAWVKTTGTEDGGYIMSKGSGSGNDFGLYRNPDNTLRVEGAAVTDIPGYTLGETSNDWDFVVVTFDGANKNTYLNNVLISSVPDATTDFTGGGTGQMGQYVRIEQNTQNVRFNLAEVQVFDAASPGTNLAASGTASQVDTQQSHVASRAIDDNTDGNMLNNSVAETKKGNNRWWEVDLGSELSIGDIQIWNRTDCCGTSLAGAVVKILDASRAEVATSLGLSNFVSQTASFPSTGSGTLMIGATPLDTSDSTYLLQGEVALPFMAGGAYTTDMINHVYTTTSQWFAPETHIFLQGFSNDVVDVAVGDDGDYFVTTSDNGITHFDQYGVVIRTLTEAATDSFNTQIVSNYINEIDYKDRYLLVSYDDPDGSGPLPARGIEVVNIGFEPND